MNSMKTTALIRTASTLALAAFLGLAVARPAAASHMFFEDVQGNGTALTPGSDSLTPPATPDTIVGTPNGSNLDVTFSGGVYGANSSQSDTLDFTFTQTGGSATNGNFVISQPFSANATVAGEATTSVVYPTVTFDGTYQGTIFVDIPASNPDYDPISGIGSDQSGNTYGDGATFAVSIAAPAPQPSAVPEPGTMSLLGIGLVGLVASRRRRKKEQDDESQDDESATV